MKLRFVLAALMATVVCLPARADVKPHPLIGDGMVLQQGTTCNLWGTADPGEKVSVTLNAGVKSLVAEATAGQDGKWTVKLTNLEAGGPYLMTITGKNKIALQDVYVGEVWVASGQSNMQMALNGCADAEKHKQNSNNPKIRFFTVRNTTADTPQDNVPVDKTNGKWLECGPDTVGGFSGVAYFFGRDLQAARNVPVGIIHSSWGGTICEAWTPMKSLEAVDSLNKEIVEPYKASHPKAVEKFSEDLEEVQRGCRKGEEGRQDSRTTARRSRDQSESSGGALQRHDPSHREICDQGGYLVSGRIERGANAPEDSTKRCSRR